MLVKKARFIDDNKILLGLLSNELILFNHQQKQVIYIVQISAYSFSDFCLNDDKSQVITADESGIIHLISTNDGKILNEYSGNNVDNIYKAVFQNGTIITGGQDRRIGIYHTALNDKYYIEGDFLVYSVGLSPDGSIGAFSASEDNDICLFNTHTKEIFLTLKGHNSTLTKIYFINNSKLITSCDDPDIFIWEIPGE
jgi:WD40 repeat protein